MDDGEAISRAVFELLRDHGHDARLRHSGPVRRGDSCGKQGAACARTRRNMVIDRPFTQRRTRLCHCVSYCSRPYVGHQPRTIHTATHSRRCESAASSNSAGR